MGSRHARALRGSAHVCASTPAQSSDLPLQGKNPYNTLIMISGEAGSGRARHAQQAQRECARLHDFMSGTNVGTLLAGGTRQGSD